MVYFAYYTVNHAQATTHALASIPAALQNGVTE